MKKWKYIIFVQNLIKSLQVSVKFASANFTTIDGVLHIILCKINTKKNVQTQWIIINLLIKVYRKLFIILETYENFSENKRGGGKRESSRWLCFLCANRKNFAELASFKKTQQPRIFKIIAFLLVHKYTCIGAWSKWFDVPLLGVTANWGKDI